MNNTDTGSDKSQTTPFEKKTANPEAVTPMKVDEPKTDKADVVAPAAKADDDSTGKSAR
jgi:hypothetical protein